MHERNFIYLVEDDRGRVSQVCYDELVARALCEADSYGDYDVVYPMEVSAEEDLTKKQRNILARLRKQTQ